MVGWFSPVRMADGSVKARQNARAALLDSARKREQQQLLIARFERDLANRPRGEVMARIRRDAGLG